MARGNHILAIIESIRGIGLGGLRTAFVFVGLVAAVPLLLALIYFSHLQREQALSEAHDHLEILTAAFASSSEPTGTPLSGPLRTELLEHSEFIAFVLNDEDRLVEVQPFASQPSLSSGEISILKSGTASDEPFLHEISGEEFLFARTEASDGRLVFVGLPADPIFVTVEEQIRRRAFMLIVVYLASVLIGLVGSEVLIFGPLTSLTRTTQALRLGNLSARSSVKGVGEVAQLATAVDDLAASVQDRQLRLEQARTEAEEARRRADLASAAKSDFLASMSHEIRTPLHSIIGHTELLLEGPFAAGQRRHAEQIEASARAVLDIVNDVLDLSVIEAGKFKVKHQPLVLGELVDNAVSIVRHFAERKRLHLEVRIDRDLPVQVIGDEGRIRQVLLNLLNNAVKFTAEGSVTLCVRRPEPLEQDLLEFSVTDTGVGIPVEEQHRLFHRFAQVGSNHVHGGTGLGLSISKRLVEEMGGTIGLRSEPTKGATFWARIPLPASVMAPSTALPDPTAEGKQLKILVADDVQMNIEIARAALESAGHTVDTAHSGDEAVSMARRRKYDVILMDVQMSPLDGLAAAAMIRSEPGPNRSTTIVAMTANVLPDQIDRYRAAGMDDHIGKPFKRADLLDKLRGIVRETSSYAGALTEPGAAPDFDGTVFDELALLLDEQQLASWIERLREESGLLLTQLIENSPDRAELARCCHGLVSHAGSLGYVRLADACRDLEEACLEPGSDIAPYSAAAAAAAKKALERLAS